MNRKKFLKNSLLGLAATTGVTALASQTSTYNRLMEQVGFNHLPNKEEQTMKTVLHKAQTRGHANHGWLDSHHSFSFANYYNPQRMNFGVLRVLNDDSVAAARGFSTHPHDNMEIISIPLEGDLEHKDSMGNVGVIKKGDVQVMSAGTGIFHSEKNRNADKEVKFLQIWMFPNKRDVKPRYDQITLNESSQNELQQILSPSADDEGVWAHQNAWFHMGKLEKGKRISYEVNAPKTNGVYAFVLEGSVKIEGQELDKRDGFGLWETEAFDIEASEDARVLLMEVPMAVS
ncbi:MAG: pirin family protein [Chitinophagales bacterium]